MSRKLSDRTTKEVLEHHLIICRTVILTRRLTITARSRSWSTWAARKKGFRNPRLFQGSIATCLPPESTYETIHQYVCGESHIPSGRRNPRFTASHTAPTLSSEKRENRPADVRGDLNKKEGSE